MRLVRAKEAQVIHVTWLWQRRSREDRESASLGVADGAERSRRLGDEADGAEGSGRLGDEAERGEAEAEEGRRGVRRRG